MDQVIEFISNHPLLSGVWALLVVLIVGSWISSLLSAIKPVSPTQLTLAVNRENAVVVDIRTEAEFAKGHITDAKHLTQAQIDKQQLAGLEKQKDAPIIVVCQTGMTANRAASALAKQGFTKVSTLQGGMSAWTGASLPVVKSKR
ncbi:rhodanese-like domain-containing protein [Alishewanella sp. 16-MA]|uniref:Rhodanese-like domain-containing protein n=1 Tax=Alishewanella maricola TaxID=2795740 RepID=A0ABS8BZ47_9ALTE|nr:MULTISPECIES: rhodanese-like domain-containing protein [Gammaproteobacteria]MDP4946575.1 rhodanese-like domain-containing protein [Alishewanella sp.]MDP5206743.1 rhodanese-like domain-containing protein [Alishewanella sp. SMS9]MCB5225336.1 rhodanese-like domain-containing protein [Alishewanella maricola]MCC5453334.1 rhodanese-like domain-containing protein [Rheinheimera sp. UJ51]MCF4008408.1 rhodanese-like domain-containing protein [Rheinheimera sp. UJ63]